MGPVDHEVQTDRPGRIDGVDLARAVAVLGMIAAHFNPGQLDQGDWLRQIVSGRSAVLFVVLAGISVVIAAGTADGGRPRPGARAGLAVRAAALFVLGLALSALGTTVKEILSVYAVLFLLATMLFTAGVRTLLTLAGVLAVAGPFASFLLRSGPLPPGVPGRTPQPGALLSLDGLADTATGLLLDGPYPVLTWLPFLLVGMALARSGLRDVRLPGRLVVGGVVLAVVATASSWVVTGPLGAFRTAALATGTSEAEVRAVAASPLGAVPTEHPAYLLITSPHSGSPLEIAASTGLALAVLGACLALGRCAPELLAPLLATGRLALSVYAGHILLIAAIGLPGMVALLTDQGYGLLLLTLLATPLLALGWTTWAGRGPLERLVSAMVSAASRRVRPSGSRPQGLVEEGHQVGDAAAPDRRNGVAAQDVEESR